MREKQDSGTGRGCIVNQEGLQYCLFVVHPSGAQTNKESSLSHAAWATKPFGIEHELVFRHQGTQPKVLNWRSLIRSS